MKFRLDQDGNAFQNLLDHTAFIRTNRQECSVLLRLEHLQRPLQRLCIIDIALAEARIFEVRTVSDCSIEPFLPPA